MCVCVSNLCVAARRQRRGATGLSKLPGPPRVLEKRLGGALAAILKGSTQWHSPDVQEMKQCQRMIVFSGDCC